ncbi:MAG: toll/interleukin-1 receptor domain-containing protein, partial [Anaerolineae bacterium]|nr:toll/interleukin-1 receptor domain-containing protein [Anaerolineae bacterium]
MSHIFVSHASADDTIVTRIHDEVEAATRAALWVDHEDIATGANWQRAIDRALADASHMILVVSRASVTREEVMAEWRDALLRGVPVLPAIIDDVPLLDIPARLRLIQPVNLHADWARGIGQLASAITGTPAPDGSPAPHFTRRKITARPPIPRELIAIPMHGRETSYDEALACLRDAPTTVEGVGGLGKSRLAAEIVANSPDV